MPDGPGTNATAGALVALPTSDRAALRVRSARANYAAKLIRLPGSNLAF